MGRKAEKKKTEVYAVIYLSVGVFSVFIYIVSKLQGLQRRNMLSVTALLLEMNRRKLPVRGLLRRWNHRKNRRTAQLKTRHEWTAPATEDAAEEAWVDEEEQGWPDADEPTKLVVELRGEIQEIEIDLRNVCTIDELQDEVADACAIFDEDDLDEDLVMQFEDGDTGEWHIVTNSVPYGRVRRARQLRLAPRDSSPAEAPERKSRRGKGGREKSNGPAVEMDDDDDLTGRPSGRVGLLLKGRQDSGAASALD